MSRVQLRQTAANTLRNHFDTEASDAGLRSLDLASTGASGSRSYDAGAVARVDSKHGMAHRRVRSTLQAMLPRHVEILSLAYGIRLRTRDTEDGKHRKALRQTERGWRVRLAELYGADGAVVLASPLAQRLYGKDVDASKDATGNEETTFIAWLLANTELVPKIAHDARDRLNEALDEFIVAHGIVEAPRERSSEKTRARILAHHPEHGVEIGG